MAESEDCILTASTSSRDTMSSSGSSVSISLKTALNDCSAAWINYLTVLNRICAAGSKLANSIAVLEQCGVAYDKPSKVFTEKTAQNHPLSYLTSSWSDLSRATAVATSTVKSHIMSVLQDFVISTVEQPATICEIEQKRIRDHNEMIILENAQVMVNVQHQFCAASNDAFSCLTSCFVCQSPIGFPHDQECTIIQQKSHLDQRSQTPSPHFGGSLKIESRGNSIPDQRQGCTAAQMPDQMNFGMEQPRGLSPQQNFRDSIPLQAIFENTRGPLPNPGHLLSMKIPFYRSGKSPLNLQLFPLNGQRRWSEAAAGEVSEEHLTDAESQIRRWSMPWEASKTDHNTVTWYHTRIMPMNIFKMPNQKFSSVEQSNSNTPDSNWKSSMTSQDGLTEAIQLLSCRPAPSQVGNMQQIYPLVPPDVSSADESNLKL